MTCGQEALLNNLGSRLRIAELLFMNHITVYEDQAINLMTPELTTLAVERVKSGMAKPLSKKEKEYLYSSEHRILSVDRE